MHLLTVPFLLLSQFGLAQFVTPPNDLITKTGNAGINVRYKEVPTGICEQNPNVKSYSGYADVSENEHVFWWFFEARNVDPTTAPLTLWINGGPGSSSMIGLFQELGPCTVNASGVVVDNPFSWSNVSNMIFIDQPTQTGFSYSIPVLAYTDPDSGDIITLPNNTCPDYASDWDCGTYSLPDLTLTANSTPSAAPNMYLALQAFTGAFPQYASGDFFFATESYGGHYGPIFTDYFLNQSLQNHSTYHHSIVPKALLIGNGWFDPLTQYEAYYNYTVTPGNTYDLESYNATVESRLFNNLYGAGNCYDQIVQCNANPTPEVCSKADNFCYANVEVIFDTVTGRDEYDIRQLTPDPFPPTFYVDYLNSEMVQAAIGAYVNFSESSSAVGDAFGSTGDDAIAFNIPVVISKLLAANISTILYFGDADYICNWIGGQAIIPLMSPQPASFSSSGFENIAVPPGPGLPSNNKFGEVRQASTASGSNFAFVRIYESGHEVPFYQPAGSLVMFDRIVKGLDIATGIYPVEGANYLSIGPMTSTYLEGNSTVETEVLEGDGWVYDVASSRGVNSSAPFSFSGRKERKRLTDRTARNMPWKQDLERRGDHGIRRGFEG